MFLLFLTMVTTLRLVVKACVWLVPRVVQLIPEVWRGSTQLRELLLKTQTMYMQRPYRHLRRPGTLQPSTTERRRPPGSASRIPGTL